MEENLFGCSKTNERMKIGFWGGEAKKGRREYLDSCFVNSLPLQIRRNNMVWGERLVYIAREHGVL